MKKKIVGIVILFFLLNTYATFKIITFSSPKTIYDFEFRDEEVWVATSGGLLRYNQKTKEKYLRPINSEFPDPVIVALEKDDEENIWAASKEGYLLKIDKQGKEFSYNSYATAFWRINDIKPYKHYLIIASDKGISIFDIKKCSVIKNATKIGTFIKPDVNTIAIYKNKLYAGCANGLAILKYEIDKISTVNFYDASVWETNSYEDTTEIKYFLEYSDKLLWYSTPVTLFKNRILKADSNTITYLVDEPFSIPFKSKITSLKVEDKNVCWIGTEEDFFYRWKDGVEFDSIPLPSTPTFTSVNRVYVDRSGKLWVLPYGIRTRTYNPPWWLGINSFDGRVWKCYSPSKIPEMGHLGESEVGRGIAQTRDGKMWFGVYGGAIKSYDPAKDEWYHYCNYGLSVGDGIFLKVKGQCPIVDWGACDAIAQDSSGYMWLGSWNNFAGCLICYKPTEGESDSLKGNYRRFPPEATKDISANVTAITVDKANNIIYGATVGSNVTLNIIRHHGNPIKDGIIKVKEFTDLKEIRRLISLNDTSTIVLTEDNIYKFTPSKMKLEELKDSTRTTNFDKNIIAIDAESDNIFWYAVTGKGVIRYDLKTNQKTTFGREKGIIFNRINDIHVDKKNGFVWVAGDIGITRISLGYNISEEKNEEKILIFPNPFSLSSHQYIEFRNIPIDGKLYIYSMTGTLIGKPSPLLIGEENSVYQWYPNKKLSPGTYFYVIYSDTKKQHGKLMIVP